MPSPHEIGLQVGGRIHTDWLWYDIDSDLLTGADAWQLALSPTRTLPASVEPGAPVVVTVGGEAVLRGFVDDIEDEAADDGLQLSLSGRDGAGVLIDCSAPIFVAKMVTLKEVVDKIVKPLGVASVHIDATTKQMAEKVNIEPGDTAWDALVKSAEANGLWPWFDPSGVLVIGGPNYSAQPVASLILRRDGKGNNVKRLSRRRSQVQRHSEVTVLGQQHGTEDYEGRHALKVMVKDTGVNQYRPRILIDHDAETAEAGRSRARKTIADGRLAGLRLTATVKGHRTSDGLIWTPGQRIHVVSEYHGIDDVYFLMSRRFRGGDSRPTETVLSLVEDGVWVPDAHPHKRRQRRGKNQSAGEIIDVA